MTGYGEAAFQSKRVRLIAQIRSLNHRNLDIQIRAPREYLSLEEEIRQQIRTTIGRGRVELFLTRLFVHGTGRTIELDEHLVRQYLAALRRAQRKFALQGNVDVALLGSRTELFYVREASVESDDEKPLVLKVVAIALRNLHQSRTREGRSLQRDIRSQIKQMRLLHHQLTLQARVIPERLRNVVLPGRETDGSGERSVVAEATFKGDIHEEVVRLHSHIKELTRIVRGSEPSGKRIDFILQEMQREFNTIGSKASQLAVTRMVLEGKERVEKIREQAQNVE
jgi:uncharacterized protein (TIGR00255 family)